LFELTRNARPYLFAIIVCYAPYFSLHQTICFPTSPPPIEGYLLKTPQPHNGKYRITKYRSGTTFSPHQPKQKGTA